MGIRDSYYMTRFFFLFKIYFISIMCVSVCLWVPRRPEQDILSSGASILSPTWVPGTKIQSSARAASTGNCKSHLSLSLKHFLKTDSALLT